MNCDVDFRVFLRAAGRGKRASKLIIWSLPAALHQGGTTRTRSFPGASRSERLPRNYARQREENE